MIVVQVCLAMPAVDFLLWILIKNIVSFQTSALLQYRVFQ
jgi:hypothetical protein